jgi:ATP-dependent helicase HrpB
MSGLPSLPIEEALPALRAQLAAHPNVVLQAPPGAGKTTVVPLALLAEPWLAGRSILILEPRRLAARAAAARMAELVGESVGDTVGFRIRFETRVSRATRIEVLTEGILTRRIQADPALEGVGLVIFDEFHERHLQTDLALALTLDAQRGLREDLKILVMSATLDVQAVAQALADAPVVTSEGRQYPIDIRYLPRDPDGPLPDTVATHVRHAFAAHPGDLLAFLPGGGEIRRVTEMLRRDPALAAAEVHPLYGDLPKEAQDRAIRPHAGVRKIVLATPIAESSLTIDGVQIVVDAGFARTPRFDPVSGLTRLETVRVSKQSAEQRAGRAGRLAPGVCYRLWTETTQRGLVARSVPEILSVDLTPLALELAQWGADVAALTWLDAPPAPALAQARALLRELDALDSDGRITDAGRAMAALPLHPRLAHMLRAAQSLDLTALACDVAALLVERDILLREAARQTCDLNDRVEALIAFREQGRAAAQARGADAGACARVEQAAAQWRRLLKVPAAPKPGQTHAQDVGLLLALTYPDRIAQQRDPQATRYRLANGKGARLACEDHLRKHAYLVAASLDAGRAEGVIYLAGPVEAAVLRTHLGAHIRVADRVYWDEQQEAVIANREERLGEIVLDSRRLDAVAPEQRQAAMLAGVQRLGIQVLPWTPEARELQARVLSLRQWLPEEEWPDWSDTALATTADIWLGPYLAGMTRREHLARLDLFAILSDRLDWQQRQRLEANAPTHIEVPSGSRLRLHYAPGEAPVLAVKLQEMFGLADTPRVAGGRIPVTLHLLSPAQRPIQVTQDLRGFWERTYAEVRKELKGRYPKHPWPDDPWSATPTARARRRGS